MNDIIVNTTNGQLTVSSLQIAESFEKQHKNVVQSIENIKAENSAVTPMFIENTYKAGTGKAYKCYDITRDGFSLLVMGFTGKKALEWKLKYIEAFNLMETKLREQDSRKAFIEEKKQKIQLSNHYLKLAECKGLTQAQRNRCIESAFAALGDKIKIKTAPDWDLQEQAEYILEKLASVDSDVISLRELCRKCRKFSSVQELRKPVEYLIKSGYLCEIPIKYRGTGRRNSPIYKINL